MQRYAHEVTRHARFIVLPILVAACYREPESDEFDKTFSVARTDQSTPIANGLTPLEFTISLESGAKADTAIQVTVSSGVVNSAADPTSADARKLSLTTAGQSTVHVPVRAGTAPGPLIVAVTIGGATKYASADLQPSLPSAITLSGSRTDLPADGASQIDLTATLFANPSNAAVSAGTRVSFAVCCPNATDASKPAACPTAPPLTLVDVAQIASGNNVVVHAVSNFRPASTPKERMTVLVVVDANQSELACEAAPALPSLRAALPVTIALVSP